LGKTFHCSGGYGNSDVSVVQGLVGKDIEVRVTPMK